jgi:hypothetical protein
MDGASLQPINTVVEEASCGTRSSTALLGRDYTAADNEQRHISTQRHRAGY